MDIVSTYYDQYDEESRLIKDKTHNIEFLTTIRTIEKYIKSGDKILEIGAATGRYSIYYAESGYDVTAVDIVDKHISILNSKVEQKGLQNKIKVFKGDARDLSFIKDESFDIVLCLGPLYHLDKKEDKLLCISEALRCLKKDGIFFGAYINKCAAFLNRVMGNVENVDKESVEEVFKIGHTEDKTFCFMEPSEFRNMMKEFNVEELTMVGTDGISGLIGKTINNFDDGKFNIWLQYHFDHCDDYSILGYSLHGLYVCRK